MSDSDSGSETDSVDSVDDRSERLDELERKIEEVRHRAEEDDLLDNPNDPKFYELFEGDGDPETPD
ncbi:MAG: hypothetical protein ACRD0A_02640 [Acidimicrobiales bacterium]